MAKKQKKKFSIKNSRLLIPAFVVGVALVGILVYGLFLSSGDNSPKYIFETTPTYSDEKIYGLKFETATRDETMFTVYKSARDEKELRHATVELEIQEISYRKTSTINNEKRYVMDIKIHEAYRTTDVLGLEDKSVGRRLRLLERLPGGAYLVNVTTSGTHEESFVNSNTVTTLPTITRTIGFDIP